MECSEGAVCSLCVTELPFETMLPFSIEVRKLPHPGRLGLMNFQENGARIGYTAARRKLMDGFSLG